MNLILIAVKQGVSNFGAGSIFLVDDNVITKKGKQYYQLPDDGMGRIALVEAKDVMLIDEQKFNDAEKSHGRCNFSKDEILHLRNEKYEGDFSVRTISFVERFGEWFLMWRLPKKNKLLTASIFTNKITKERYTLEAECAELEYEINSINPTNYAQTTKKYSGLHNLWCLTSLPPGFYKSEIDLGESFKGTVHFIKHYPVKINTEDPRKTDAIKEIAFSEDLWNAALEIKLAWGPEMTIPFQVRLQEKFPDVTWAEANYLEKICSEASSFAWRGYALEAEGVLTLQQATEKITQSFPWLDEERQSRLRTLGQYYARR